ncbi:uncharacterized protein L3040_005711 [Drepanopeziza brunnea f. sp. 'multigermtubi']|uniref:Uncharacterized protein n=1 Tax=Marssonina brunnea f. sp. multigermtubi (strain MB_m1) TaxID=1072389 RepID=K1W908_MARBU|nr:uncharacterized protein MBM_07866 [Drepanopeziza brunnea f. sp. 'multigermtubi' MB_m1]EKD13665.1 hypothetical protein MBM_07866 [Drepanopeziza brunnea f. sp. 'multigermtubi' MB_m1]KAJ5041160.1 hypothetical protein L3040_005711 [Drepanopeziza brunnea f. sp. 'multigermtubi']
MPPFLSIPYSFFSKLKNLGSGTPAAPPAITEPPASVQRPITSTMAPVARPHLDPNPKTARLLNLDRNRTRQWCAPSPGGHPGLGLFPGLYSPGPKKRLPKEPPALYPGLTPWMHDWATDLNDQLPEDDGFEWDSTDIPDDGFSLGEPLEELNYWEQNWIDKKLEQEAAEKEKRKMQSLKRKRSVPLTAAGRKKLYKKRAAESTVERLNGKFMRKEPVIIIGDEEADIAHQATMKSIMKSLAKARED